jgi:spoIIIJ-associated protein
VKDVTVSGKSVDEALRIALDKLQANEDQVTVEVLEEPKRGLLGLIGSKQAVIKVTVNIDPARIAADYLQKIIKNMGINVEVDIEKVNDREYHFQIKGDELAIIIGKRGLTLNALQYLTNLVANQNSDYGIRIELDAEDYRLRRKESLEKLAHRTAERVIKTKRSVKLEPMPSYERKVVHTALQENTSVSTFSSGEDPHRAVVIELNSK